MQKIVKTKQTRKRRVRKLTRPRALGRNPSPLKRFLSELIGAQGIAATADLFGVTEASVYHWYRGANLPRPAQMQQVVEMSKGKVSYALIIETFNKAQAKKKV